MNAAQKIETADEFIKRTGCLRRFTDGQRVRVIAKDHPLFGKTGKVWRCLIRGIGPWNQDGLGVFYNIPEAWVTMDEPLPDDLRQFPANDMRGKAICLYACDCGADS